MKLNAGIVAMTEEEYHSMSKDCFGVCLNCGATRDSCEPDAREYLCEACEQHAVYGLEELMIMNKLEFVGEED